MDSLYLALGLFFLYSFFGWLAEVAFSAVSRKKFVNTGFLTGPVCPIYGVGILFILRFLEPLRNDLFFLFVGSTVVATVLEYAANRFLEGLTGTKWWDYSRFRFHFGGYVCLPFSAFWGAGAVVIVRWINPLVVRLVQLIPVPVGRVILLGCVILLGLDLIATAGADRVLTMDLHAPQIQGFFNIPVDHLLGVPLLVPYFTNRYRAKETRENLVIVSPDLGSVTRARNFAQKLDVPIAIVDKRRQRANSSEVMNIIGDVRDKELIIVDDMIDTGGSLVGAAKALKEIGGARSIRACATHGVLSGEAIRKIEESYIEEVILLDTIPLPPEKRIDKITCLNTAEVFAEAIERIYEDLPISSLFN